MAVIVHWFVYLLRDPRDNAIRYVGWCINPVRRLRDHEREARSSRIRTHKANWIRALHKLQLCPRLCVVQRGAGAGWREAEQRWIKKLRSIGCDLTNATDGGDGVLGLVFTAAHRQRISDAKRGQTPSAATRAAVAESNRRRGCSDVTRARRSASLTGVAKPSMRGRALSADHLAQVTAANRAHAADPQIRAKISRTLTGRPRPPEVVARIQATKARKREEKP